MNREGGPGPVRSGILAGPPARTPPPLPVGFWAGSGLLAALAAWAAWRRWRGARGWTGMGGPREPRPNGRVGSYHLVRPLGRGAFATTFLARHRGTGRVVALKILAPDHHHDPDLRWRLHQEARLAGRLDHPGLAPVLDREPGPEPAWIALDYVAGPTLEERLRDAGPLPAGEAAAIALAIARALAHAHDRGVAHLDLKPANVILGPQGPTVTDLGSARALHSADPDRGRVFLGTPAYAAPEAWTAEGAGPAADRYSLGVVLFEMMAGRPPFPGPGTMAFRAQHRTAAVPDLRVLAGVPAALADLVERLLAKDPVRRPGDADLLAALEGLVPAPAVGLSPPRGRPEG